MFYVTCHKNLISDWNWNSYFLYQLLLYYEHYNWLNATWAFLVPFVWNSCCPCIMIYWLVDACKLGAFCCHCMLNGDQCFYKRIEQQQKNLLRNLECGFDFEIWCFSWPQTTLDIVLLKEIGLIDADLLQGHTKVPERVKWNNLPPHWSPHLRYNITD